MRVPSFLLPLKNVTLAQVTNVEGLMVLLMKQRNGQVWTSEDKAQLVSRLKSLASILPALTVFSLPGGAFLLPVLAWFLDRRRKKKERSAAGTALERRQAATAPPEQADSNAPADLQTPSG